ncbi:MAG: hypothetical protein ACI9H6_000158 [Patiriisocius sp.]|jgi:hypothetical protein
MSKIILIAGYTKLANIRKIRSYFPGEDITLACAYARAPETEAKQKNLALFDVLYDLTLPEDVQRLQDDADSVAAITCTQERDMPAYIQAQLLCGKITDTQAQLYKESIDKRLFKEGMSQTHPELVPQTHLVDEELLSKLDTLSYPLVIKPSGLAGSIMIRVVHSPEEFLTHYQTFAPQMHEIAQKHYLADISVIAESYIEGPQYSVNVYINAEGAPTFCPLVRVVTPQELGGTDTYSVYQYTTDEVTDAQLTDLKQSVAKVIARFELKDTSAHFDSVYSNGQWKFFEVGLRIGGNRQKLFEYSHGMDHFGNDVKNKVGKAIEIPELKKSVCVMQKASTEEGVLQSISYTRKVTAEHAPMITEDKMAKIGKDVMQVSQGGGTVTRHYIVGKEHQEVVDTSKELFEAITFEVI